MTEPYTMEDRYAQVLLLFGPPPDEIWIVMLGWESARTKWSSWLAGYEIIESWQRPLQVWLYEQGITRSPTDGSWIREFCKWHRDKCNETP